ncbi:hypothetical protein [Streptomyces sp. NPDC001978]|uniref:hypothetical protein n=1 Tax=Streptomyces sp. NPDC001978 TaxID=3364627 RepID=UPI0036CF79A7
MSATSADSTETETLESLDAELLDNHCPARLVRLRHFEVMTSLNASASDVCGFTLVHGDGMRSRTFLLLVAA